MKLHISITSLLPVQNMYCTANTCFNHVFGEYISKQHTFLQRWAKSIQINLVNALKPKKKQHKNHGFFRWFKPIGLNQPTLPMG